MKISNVYPGTAAEKAGLKAGDVLRSANGYLTEQRGNLAWIIANATPNNVLKLNVQTAATERPIRWWPRFPERAKLFQVGVERQSRLIARSRTGPAVINRGKMSSTRGVDRCLRSGSGARVADGAFVLAVAGAMSGTSAFGQGGGGLFGGLFRGRAAANGNANLGYYPYYGDYRESRL